MIESWLTRVDFDVRLRYVPLVTEKSKREHVSCTPSGGSRTGARNGQPRAEDVTAEVLLGRSIIDFSGGKFGDYLAGANVLVTGAGGSVGGELCARLTGLGVRQLVVVDQAEAPLVGLERALRKDFGFARVVPVLLDIRSRTRTLDVFERHRPKVAFHAAAYKHVPLLEAFPVEGVATNVLGTKSIIDAALRVGVDRFVLFSTDKAVHASSILGQTKAVAEWIVAVAGRQARHGRYASVRLGNVMDSAGSILPIFRQQVANGGPITVTHPGATRYLMTAAEAAGLAIVAGGLADSKSVFWLDSGPPVRVLDLARRLASASSRDVGFDFVGLRAGERLHEHLFSNGDEIAATLCENVWRSSAGRVDAAWLNRWLAVLARQVDRASAAGVRAALAEMHCELREVPPAADHRPHVRHGSMTVVDESPVFASPRMMSTRRYFERRALAFDRLYTRRSMAMRLRRGPQLGRELAISVVAQHQAPKVLDVGCGPGRVAEAIIAAGSGTYVGIDFSPRMMELARRRLDGYEGVELLDGNFLDLEVPRTFDIVLALGLFDYLEEPVRAAAWLRARCSSTLLASFTRWDWVKAPVRHFHYELLHQCPISNYTEVGAVELLAGAGFSRVDFVHRGRRGFFLAATPA
jgi:nucleoside-diphosphate-sugar epimerase/SAM-dependent methyltransferase